jgi:hypothetical protein
VRNQLLEICIELEERHFQLYKQHAQRSATWDYSSDPEGLVQIFSGGAFAVPIDSPPVPVGITAFLSSPVINYLWGSQKAFIVKLSDTVTGNSCGSNL